MENENENEISFDDWLKLDLPDLNNKTASTKVETKDIDPMHLAAERANTSPLKYGFTLKQAERYSDPLMPYNPNVNMEDLYAKTNPFSLGDSMNKMLETFKLFSLGSWDTIKAGALAIKEGNSELLWDNKYSEELALLQENLEDEIPQYFTQDETDNPLTFRNLGATGKSIVPAFGTALGGVTDMVIGHVAATGVGALAGGVGAIPTNIAQLGRDGATLGRVMKNLYTFGRGLTQSKTAQNVMNSSKLMLSSLFFANNEAALQGKLNAQSFIDKEVQKYVEINGSLPSLEEMQKLEETATNIGRDTYKANLALISASQAIQVPGLLMGKVQQSLVKKMPYKIVDGKVVFKSSFKDFAVETIKDSVAEGLEEFGQGVIDKTVTDYYTSNEKHASYTDSLIKGLNENLNQEGLISFLGGVVVGGGMNVGGNLAKLPSTVSQRREATDLFDKTTTVLLNSHVETQNNLKNMTDSLTKGNLLESELQWEKEAFNNAYQHSKLNTLEAFEEQMDTLITLPINEFNEMYGLELQEGENVALIEELKNSIISKANTIKEVESQFRFNIFAEDKGIKKIVNRLSSILGRGDKETNASLFEDFKRQVALNKTQIEKIDSKLKEIKDSIPEMAHSLITNDIAQSAKNFENELNGIEVVWTEDDKRIAKLIKGKSPQDILQIALSSVGDSKTLTPLVYKAIELSKRRDVYNEDFTDPKVQKKWAKTIAAQKEINHVTREAIKKNQEEFERKNKENKENQKTAQEVKKELEPSVEEKDNVVDKIKTKEPSKAKEESFDEMNDPEPTKVKKVPNIKAKEGEVFTDGIYYFKEYQKKAVGDNVLIVPKGYVVMDHPTGFRYSSPNFIKRKVGTIKINEVEGLSEFSDVMQRWKEVKEIKKKKDKEEIKDIMKHYQDLYEVDESTIEFLKSNNIKVECN